MMVSGASRSNEGTPRRTNLDSHSVELHVQHVVNESLVGPGVGEHGNEIDVSVEDDEY